MGEEIQENEAQILQEVAQQMDSGLTANKAEMFTAILKEVATVGLEPETLIEISSAVKQANSGVTYDKLQISKLTFIHKVHGNNRSKP